MFSQVFSSASVCEKLGPEEGCGEYEELACVLVSFAKSDIKVPH